MSDFRNGLCACAAVIGVSLLEPSPVAAESTNERPAAVVVVMSISRNYNGTYRLKEVARVCGELPKELNFAGVPLFHGSGIQTAATGKSPT